MTSLRETECVDKSSTLSVPKKFLETREMGRQKEDSKGQGGVDGLFGDFEQEVGQNADAQHSYDSDQDGEMHRQAGAQGNDFSCRLVPVDCADDAEVVVNGKNDADDGNAGQ